MKTVIASEYTRRVAHELDDRHSAWVMYNRVEKVEAVSEIGTSIFEERPDHEKWLTDYENLNTHLMQAAERVLQIQGYLSQFKKPMQRREYAKRYKVPLWQIDVHLARVKSELAYASILQIKLKEVKRASRVHLDEKKLSELGGQDGLLYRLFMAAKESLRYDSVEPLRRAMDDDDLGNLIRKVLATPISGDLES